MSTNTQRATFKSSKPTMSKYNDKQSNYRLLNVLCCTKAVFADFFAKVINGRRKKRYDFPINISPTYISVNVKFSIPTKKSPKFFTFLRFLDQSSCITSYKMWVSLVK